MSHSGSPHILWFDWVNIRSDRVLAGGKGLNLAKLVQNGVHVPPGFVITTCTWHEFMEADKALLTEVREYLEGIVFENGESLQQKSDAIWKVIVRTGMSQHLEQEIIGAYDKLGRDFGKDYLDVAVRSSAVGEDMEDASFAGQHATYLNVRRDGLIGAIKNCFASLFTARVIAYRHEKNFPIFPEEGLAVIVQKMVRSDKGASGVAFTHHPTSLAQYMVHIEAIYGLGEMMVGGDVVPDIFQVAKPLAKGADPVVIAKQLGSKEFYMQYAHRSDLATEKLSTPASWRQQFCITDAQAREIARMCCEIERLYGHPVDIEFATDGDGVRMGDGRIYIVQARPVTFKRDPYIRDKYELDENALSEGHALLLRGIAAGPGVGIGKVSVIENARDFHSFHAGEVLVTEMTTPDWMPVMREAAAIITNQGGMTCHAAIVARELGKPCLIGTGNGTEILAEAGTVTVICDEDGGKVFDGELPLHKQEINLRPAWDKKGSIATKVMFIAGEPDTIASNCFYPNDGIGLARMEFIIANQIKVHPRVVLADDLFQFLNKKEIVDLKELLHGYESPREFFIWKLQSGIMQLAAAVWPNPIIVRMSDFKTNEYANLLGGSYFEKHEENPMLGFRGAGRYLHESYRSAFLDFECEALRRAREAGFTNIKAMLPFVRTPATARAVINLMASAGLVRGENGFEVYCMVELPCNVVDMQELGDIFDGFSIGSNDLTQTVLGQDRDNAEVTEGNEMTPSVLWFITTAIDRARQLDKPIGICGQAPTNHPEIVSVLVKAGITSISVAPDAIPVTIEKIYEAERERRK